MVTANGASGGCSNCNGMSCSYASGGSITAHLDVTSGQTLYVFVGQIGGFTNGCGTGGGGYNGGTAGSGIAAGGGGATDIRTNMSYASR